MPTVRSWQPAGFQDVNNRLLLYLFNTTPLNQFLPVVSETRRDNIERLSFTKWAATCEADQTLSRMLGAAIHLLSTGVACSSSERRKFSFWIDAGSTLNDCPTSTFEGFIAAINIREKLVCFAALFRVKGSDLFSQPNIASAGEFPKSVQ